MVRSFRDALLDAAEKTGESLAKIAKATGVSYEQLKKIKQRPGSSTNVDDALKIANFFGLSLDEFMGDDTRTHRDEILTLYRQLSEQERDLLLAAARGFAAAHRGEV